MITSLLIANRGEIACRIMRTCRGMGIRTIAVYSDADARAKHVREADEAVWIGESAATESYLVGDRIIAAAKEAGADAIHPGYGFLSENAAFARAVVDAGLIWVGPKADTIDAMGLKDRAKAIAEEAGVPVLPGYRGEAQDAATLTTHADKIGYPLLIKAVAGGGGRGIRLVASADALAGELESAVREAESAFGDGRVMLEKLVEQPRHIEVQVFGDAHGNAVHLYERDCSLQRRRQKVIEEAPAPGMPEDVRAAMCGAAVKLAQTVGYEGAGTVEFIVDGARPLALDTFWFLEMNTRLQVEHPVTEMVTGTDLVEWQLRVASGEELPAKQDEIALLGHAIEARICAEDPANDFMPSTGLITSFSISAEGFYNGQVNGRLDFGFVTGDRVPSSYDSMIGKIIVVGIDRDEAIQLLNGGLRELHIGNLKTNQNFLINCIERQEFIEGYHDVGLIERLGSTVTEYPTELLDEALEDAAENVMRGDCVQEGFASPWMHIDGFRLNSSSNMQVTLQVADQLYSIDMTDKVTPTSHWDRTYVSSLRETWGVAEGRTLKVTIPDFEAEAEALAGGDAVKAPMPGKVIAVNVAVGDAVEKGQVLAVMEAMKMEHSLAAPRDGVVEVVGAELGAQVSEGIVLVGLVSE